MHNKIEKAVRSKYRIRKDPDINSIKAEILKCEKNVVVEWML